MVVDSYKRARATSQYYNGQPHNFCSNTKFEKSPIVENNCIHICCGAMIRLATHALAVQRMRRATLVSECAKGIMVRRSVVLFSTSDTPCNEAAKEVALPSHIKFRMPDLDFKVRLQLTSGWDFETSELTK